VKRWAALAAGIVSIVSACSESRPDDPTAFCDAIAAAIAPGGPVTNLDLDDPEAVEAANDELDNLSDLAPEEIAAAAGAVAQAYGDILGELVATAPGARTNVLRGFQGVLDSVADDAAALQIYAESACGVSFTPTTEETATPEEAG
jgi:hypothetical protein